MESFYKKINFIETEIRMVVGCQGQREENTVMARSIGQRVQISLIRRLNFEDLIYSMVTLANYRALCTLMLQRIDFKQIDILKRVNYVR